MTPVKTIRYLGLGSMLLAILILCYLFSFSLLQPSRTSSRDSYAVLILSMDSGEFPRSDFDALFSKMHIVPSSLVLDTGISSLDQQNQIASAAAHTGSDHVILLAWKDACIPALTASRTLPGMEAVVLLSPTLARADAIEPFGTHSPDIPTAIFDVNTKYAASLFERLSGEDTTLFPGLRDKGILTDTVHISPDGTRYLSQWGLPGDTEIQHDLLAYLPQVQIKIAEYIGAFVTGTASADAPDYRSPVAGIHVMKILAGVFFASGLLLFFSSIPKGKSGAGKSGGRVEGAEDAVIRRIPVSASRAKYFRFSRVMSLVTLLSAVLFLTVLIVLQYVKPGLVVAFLAAWPVVYYAVCAVFMIRFFPEARIVPQIRYKRMLFSGLLAFLTVAGILMFRAMYTFSFLRPVSGWSGALLLLCVVLVFACVWIRLAPDTVFQSDPEDPSSGKVTGIGNRLISIWIPYAGILLFSILAGFQLLAAKSLFLLAGLLISLWIRHIFRRTSGADGFAALVFSAVYLIMAFG